MLSQIRFVLSLDLLPLTPAVAAFIGAFLSGMLTSGLKKVAGYPRISLTVPSTVIMVPDYICTEDFIILAQ